MQAPVFTIAIRPSARLALALCIVHAVAVAAVCLTPVPPWLKAGLSLAILAGLARDIIHTAALRSADAIVALEIADDEQISFQTRTGAWRECELLPSSYVTPALTILNLKPVDGRRARHVVLVGDNANGADFRRLRVWLRWRGVESKGK